MWNGPINLVREIKLCEKAGATMAAVALCYVCIDTMANLSMPVEKQEQARDDFVAWVDRYLKGHPSQPYEYRGLDVYAARCGVLHSFGSEARLHRNDPAVKLYAYHDGGKHMFQPEVNDRLVLIGTASFINDVVIAIDAFLMECQSDRDLRTRVEARLPGVLAVVPLLQVDQSGIHKEENG